MKPVTTHRAAAAIEPEPPAELVRLSESLHHPLIGQCGLTTTASGRWALYVTVPADSSVPIADIEAQAHGYPVVYEAEPSEPTKAWPARPDTGR